MKQNSIESFNVDHEFLYPGLYISRKDCYKGIVATTYDLRMTAPNRESAMSSDAMHTIEHIGACYLRNSDISERVIYFGPMGCKTGFYLVVFGEFKTDEILQTVKETFTYIAEFEGDIPGATRKECGNYTFQNLELAKEYSKKYVEELTNTPRFSYFRLK